jgi:hypothetical protein
MAIPAEPATWHFELGVVVFIERSGPPRLHLTRGQVTPVLLVVGLVAVRLFLFVSHLSLKHTSRTARVRPTRECDRGNAGVLRLYGGDEVAYLGQHDFDLWF